MQKEKPPITSDSQRGLSVLLVSNEGRERASVHQKIRHNRRPAHKPHAEGSA